ncbi:MAG: molybdenum cofactor biosynthesis protein MoaB [Candidatus Bathyarchaeota archaeon]|nr:molybdenum cofactor biosynthesis protein MoaB [Candidatus Bathyarchaeota archaeon]
MSESTKSHKAHAPKKLNFAVFTCSTSRYRALENGEDVKDVSGETIEFLLKKAGHSVLFKRVILDDQDMIAHAVKSVIDNQGLDAAVFCGGTGIAPTDVTIETITPFFDKTLPGFGEIFRRVTYDKRGSSALMTRATAGVAKGKALFCIPGSPDAVKFAVELLISPEAAHIVKHAREQRQL